MWRTHPFPAGWAWLTSEASGAHVFELLQVELPLLTVERQRAPPAVVGGAQADYLLICPLQEVGPWFVLYMDVGYKLNTIEQGNYFFFSMAI